MIYCPTFLVNKTYDRKFIYSNETIIIIDINDRKFIYNNETIIIIDINENLDEYVEINMKFFGGY